MDLFDPLIFILFVSYFYDSPVLLFFLQNVSHKTLSALLEYIYTGEVLVPSENLSAFVETAKNLHIRGLENLVSFNSRLHNKCIVGMHHST